MRRLAAKFRAVPDGIVIVSQVYAMEWVQSADPSHLRVIGQSHEQYEASRGWTRGDNRLDPIPPHPEVLRQRGRFCC